MSTSDLTTELSHRQQRVLTASAAFAGLAIATSTAAQNISSLILLLCWLGMAPLRAAIGSALRTPLVRACLAFYLLLLLGALWAEVDWNSRLQMLTRMRGYLLAPVFVACLMHRSARAGLIGGFFAGVTLSVAVSLGLALTGLSIMEATPGNYPSFRTHTEHNLFIAWVAIGLLSALLWGQIQERRLRVAAVLIIALLVFDAFFLVRGRTAQVLLLLMIALVLTRRWGMRAALPMLLGTAVLLPALYFTSPVIRNGAALMLSNLEELSQGQSGENSLGLRIEFAQNTLKIIEQAPILGHGTGSFRANYQSLTGFTKAANGPHASHNPHNDYLWLWSEVGLLGPLGLLAVLAAFVISTRRLSKPQQVTAEAIALSMLIGTLGNSFFTDNVSGLGFIVVAYTLAAGAWCLSPRSEGT